MMKKVRLIVITVLILSLSFTLGCTTKFDNSSIGEGTENKEKEVNKEDSKPVDKENAELTIWSWFSFGDVLKKFESENKGIKIKENLYDFAKCKDEYMKAITNGNGPDIFVFDSGFFSQYTVGNVLEDLLKEPYSAGKYKKDFLGWDSGMSVDGKHLLSLTYSTAPYITLYRADIMKENGFPSEPEEFGKFIEDPENILKIAMKLKQKNKFIYQYPTDYTDVVGSSLGYFDKDLNYIRTGDLFAQALDLGREAFKNSLLCNGNFWQETGRKAIQEDRLVMIPAGSYAMSTLASYVPEQKGKWRVAKAPLGVAAWASDTRLSINSQSKQKNLAWKLVEYIVTHKATGGNIANVVPGYIPVHKNDKNMSRKETFFGDQVVYPSIEDLATQMVQYKLTPMNDKAQSIYINGVWDSNQKLEISYDIVQKIKEKVDTELAEEKSALLEQ
jgi:multiple sugar transport system substrate-binding protein